MRVWLGNGLMALGVALLAATGLLYGYAEYERSAFERDLARAERLDAATATTIALQATIAVATGEGLATATAVARSRETPTPASPPPPTGAAGAAPTLVPPSPISTATPVPPAPTATPVPVIMRRIVAPTIGLDSAVVESRLIDGEWQVPKFLAGHLQGTAQPGSGGNVVLSGHVQSLTAGNVFAKIDQLRPGDQVIVRTNLGDVRYVIEGKNIVKNDDLSVIRSGPREELTLITCTGSFNPITRDYDKRWVVWGVRAA